MDRFDTAVEKFDLAYHADVSMLQLKLTFYRVVVEALIKIVHSLPARETESRFKNGRD